MQQKPVPRGPMAGPSYQPPSAPPTPGGVRVGGGEQPRLQTSQQYLRTPIVRYSSRMRVGKLHPLKITLTSVSGEAEAFKPQTLSGGFDPPIVVQLTVPGALVTPPHVIMAISGGEAHFVVQPLMTGKLLGAKVEFLSQGRKVSEIALPMKANRGTLAKLLVVFALLLPFLIHYLPVPTFTDKPEIKAPPLQSILRGRRPPPSTAPVKTAPEKNTNESPEKNKSPEKQPAKNDKEKTAFQFPSAAYLTMLLINQESEKNADKKEQPPPEKNAPTETAGTRPTSSSGTTLSGGSQNLPESEAKPNAEAPAGIVRRGEDAIWAWTRNLLEQAGYPTKLVKTESLNAFGTMLTAQREYEITGDCRQEWGTQRLMAIAMYYLEPVNRLLYRFFIDFPKGWAFGDLILPLFFLALAAIIWMFTSPNKRKLKGPVMDIRLAG
ncbi:MAG: hypothetical protein JNJ77_14045 [Planctomycetia bacterium]|nr:hypothetical protein [Planctomycetia bacterium]